MSFRLPRALGVLSTALCLFLAAPAAAEPPVWTIRDADSTIVLFGSVHVLPEGLAWRPAALDAALARADDLWFETPVDGEGETQAVQAAQQNGYLPAGESLTALLTPQGRARLERVGGRLGVSPAGIDRLRPWLADITLGLLALARQGAVASAGVEKVLADAAPAARRRAFETPADQIAFFADAPLADQLASLEDTLRQLDEEPAFFDELISAWARGDTARIEALGLTPMKTASVVLYDRLIVQRNRRWAATIAERLAGSGETVIVVGAGHLVGPDSVPALLRARGIPVEGP
ncbi:MAG: TraB/GumN family protein [Caulobacter sp.]|nr:TraB/GumN family protein [Caulobacter sp.]